MRPLTRDGALRARGAAIGVLALCLGAQLLAERAGGTLLRPLIFDGYQRALPRETGPVQVRVIDVDEESLRRLGQWPWPRHRMARLVEQAAALGALAVGIDVIMSEPGRFSPAALAADHPGLEADLKARLARVPSNDAVLGDALARAPSVVARAGLPAGADTAAQPPARPAPVITEGGDPTPFLHHWPRVLVNVPEVERGARGHGLVNSLRDADAVVRRVPVVARAGADLAPSLALELLRVATGSPIVTVRTGASGVEGVRVADAFLPLDPDGALTLHFATPNPARRVSAARVLAGELAPGAFANQIAIIGVSALATVDAPATPIAASIPGVVVQAQVVESLLSGARLQRPAFAPWIESAALLLAGIVLVALLPRLGPRRGALLAGALVAVLAGGAVAAFAAARWLLDPGPPVLSTLAVCGTLLASLLALERSRSRALDEALALERDAAARLAGELDAARAIQMGLLPDPDAMADLPAGVTVAARLEPARRVGGDLYDLFMLDERHLFFAVGDVSGKGIPASLFMALSKSLCRSVVTRSGGRLAQRLSIANAEIARDNPQMLFVAVAAGLLDTASGELDLCIAGHDAPWLLRPGEPPRELDTLGGPALCVMDDFQYPAEQCRLQPGDTLVLATDGVTEALDRDGRFYGRERLAACLAAQPPAAGARQVLDALVDDVARFAAGAEPADDVTVMVLRYRGAAA